MNTFHFTYFLLACVSYALGALDSEYALLRGKTDDYCLEAMFPDNWHLAASNNAHMSYLIPILMETSVFEGSSFDQRGLFILSVPWFGLNETVLNAPYIDTNNPEVAEMIETRLTNLIVDKGISNCTIYLVNYFSEYSISEDSFSEQVNAAGDTTYSEEDHAS